MLAEDNDPNTVGDQTDDIAYVMDDGLTSLNADSHNAPTSPDRGLKAYRAGNNNEPSFITFIGTGISGIRFQDNSATEEHVTYAQNLPYGTHILKLLRVSGGYDAFIDGVEIENLDGSGGAARIAWSDFTFHQPKKPPIPEDAVVLADYMLMADFVAQTAAGIEKISKGVRRVSISRDVFADETDGDSFTFAQSVGSQSGWKLQLSGNADSDTSMQLRLPSFGTNYVHQGYQSDTRSKLFIDTTDNDSSATKDNTDAWGSYAHLTSDLTLGVYKFGSNAVSGQNGATAGFDIAPPIHTSSHYQTFETPFLHELVGGDRNMEQTNLVVTPDGKTWDEVTRDTSYIGNCVLTTSTDTSYTSNADTQIFDEWRGAHNTYRNYFNKYFAIAYDRMICLEAGQYMITAQTIRNGSANTSVEIRINGSVLVSGYTGSSNHDTPSSTASVQLKRGDYVQLKGLWHTGEDQGLFQIYKN